MAARSMGRRKRLLPAIINAVGLSLDIVGVFLLFFFGLARSIGPLDGVQKLAIGTDPAIGEANQKELRRCKCLSRLGLGCLVTGFSMQIVSGFL